MLAEDATVERLTRAVVGNREQKELRVDREHLGERCVLKVESLSALDDKGLTALKNVSLDIHAGEISESRAWQEMDSGNWRRPWQVCVRRSPDIFC